MQRRFIGRRAELSALDRHYAARRSTMIPARTVAEIMVHDLAELYDDVPGT